MKLKVYFYSTYGHNYLMAKAAAEGATDAGAEVELKRFPETIPAAVLKDMGADQAQKAFADVPELGPQDFADADGFIIVSATRFGNVPGQVQNILDQTGSQWATQSTRQQAAIVLNCWNSMCGIANSGVNGNRPGKKITSAKNRWEV
jgi:NAD(P)H dehydrogenase (quinone)